MPLSRPEAERMARSRSGQSTSGVWMPPKDADYKDGPGVVRRTPFDGGRS